MENNKILIILTPIIIIAVIIGALILGIVSYAIFNNFSKKAEIGNDKIGQSTVDSLQPGETSNNADKQTSTNTNINNNANTTTTGKENSSNSSVSASTTGKASSKQNPLSIGEWGIASKYVSSEYVDVPARVTNVTRGSNAAQELKDYLNNSSSIYKYEDAKETMEWAVIEYSIDLTKMEKDSTAKLDTKITGIGDNNSIKYNDATYFVSTTNMTPNNYTKGEIVSCKFAVQLPIGCTDYLIALGSSSGTQAFFSGK